MHINSISLGNCNDNSQMSFQGRVDKSVTNSLKNLCEQYRREKIIEVLNYNKSVNFDTINVYKSEVKDVTQRLNEFMKKCHKDSVLKFDIGKRGALRNQPRTPASLYIENKVLPKGYVSEITSSTEFVRYKPYEGDGLKELKALLNITNEFLENNTPKKCDKKVLQDAFVTVSKKSQGSRSKSDRRSVSDNLKRIRNYSEQIGLKPEIFEKQKKLILENIKANKCSS